ncbi:hypothetical protein HHK36_000801 [Tetracentron sinense]|uniref:Uncharacterized protein n=1 Tax=Tetracentron sinense TaxID=13715 RepID=A0A834ZW40_TETSI|nr:hypothetical protein HHK36_000801 [Tetracentron sinense]
MAWLGPYPASPFRWTVPEPVESFELSSSPYWAMVSLSASSLLTLRLLRRSWAPSLFTLSCSDPPLPTEIKSIANIALLVVFTGLLLYSRSMISMLFLGCFGKLVLVGGALAIGFANITSYSILPDLAMGMEPICG